MAPSRDGDRAKRTIYVTGFNCKYISKRLLEELFLQGGPVVDVTLFETHAYILFQHEESVPYCLALLNDVELYGQKLRLSPKYRAKETFIYIDYLAAVRDKLMTEYRKIQPPELPPRLMPPSKPKSKSLKHDQKQSRKSKRNRTKKRKNTINKYKK